MFFSSTNNNSVLLLELSGLNASLTNRQIYFCLALTSYMFTLFVNLTVVLTILLEKTLHEPLYILVCNLCLNGICGACTFYPKLLYDLFTNSGVISYAGCLAQIFNVYVYLFCESTTLTFMAYDRYIAICQPLRYHTVMTLKTVFQLLVVTWGFTFLEVLGGILLTARLPLCGYKMTRFYCTNWEVVKLSCTDTTVNNIYGYISVLHRFLQFVSVLVSYIFLVRSSLKFKASRRKFMQTCVPHLVTFLIFMISVYFEALFTRYSQSSSGPIARLQNALAAEVMVVPPVMNPVIYGINLHQIRTKILHNFSL